MHCSAISQCMLYELVSACLHVVCDLSLCVLCMYIVVWLVSLSLCVLHVVYFVSALLEERAVFSYFVCIECQCVMFVIQWVKV